MNIRDKANELLSKAGKTLGIQDLAFDEEDSAKIIIDNKILVIIEFDADIKSVIFNVVLGELPEKNREAILYELLSANFYWTRTEGATIGIDNESNLLCLFYMLTFPLENDSDFELVLEKLVNVAEYWIDTLQLQ